MRVEEIRWKSVLANVPAVTLKESFIPSRAAMGHENASHTTYTCFTCLENVHN